jgi:hypothetical protein
MPNKPQPSDLLVSSMLEHLDTDYTLQQVYELVCRPPHHTGLTAAELHPRVSRYVGEARAKLKRKGFVMVPGELRHSYRATKRKR